MSQPTTDQPTAVSSRSTDAATPSVPDPAPVPAGPVSVWRVVRDQRKTEYVALGFMVAGFWFIAPLGRWTLAGCVAGGVLLALLNHLATELWLLKTITSDQDTSRNAMIGATLVRLVVLSVVAVGVAVFFWPDGIGLLLGLAIFRLVALMMTSITLLKELKTP